MSIYSYNVCDDHYDSGPYLRRSHAYHEPSHHHSHNPGNCQSDEYLGYHDPYYTSQSSRFWDDGYFRNRYASYFDEYPKSSYMCHPGRFPTYLHYLRDKVRNDEIEQYPSRNRYMTYNDHWHSPSYRDSYSRGRYYDHDSYPNRYGHRSSSNFYEYDDPYYSSMQGSIWL